MVQLTAFTQNDFSPLIEWVNSEELLIQIAGTYFTYPLTDEQLQRYLNDGTSLAFNVVDVEQNKTIGHAEIIVTGDGMCKIDKLIIGDTTNRGKGIGGLVINALLQYCFVRLHANEVELNVYDWNIAGIKCYERAGFSYTGLTQVTEVNGEIWLAKNMRITREESLKK